MQIIIILEVFVNKTYIANGWTMLEVNISIKISKLTLFWVKNGEYENKEKWWVLKE